MSQRYFGPYRGQVVDNQDPTGNMRIRVRVPGMFGENPSPWAAPCVPPGFRVIPKVGALVWIQFEQGELDRPIWIGTDGDPGTDLDPEE